MAEQNVIKRKKATGRQKAVSMLYEWLDNLVFALTVVIIVLTFIFKTYTVDGTSMLPNFEDGDFVIALSLFYTPEPGDVVVIDASNNYGKPLIKRVVATAGQVVNIDAAGVVKVDGVQFEYDGADLNNLGGDHSYPLTVPEGHIFVMGDNRGVSLDSRYSGVGFIELRSVMGREIYTVKKR